MRRTTIVQCPLCKKVFSGDGAAEWFARRHLLRDHKRAEIAAWLESKGLDVSDLNGLTPPLEVVETEEKP